MKLRGWKRMLKDNRFNIGLVLISQSVALTNLLRAIFGRNIANMSNMLMLLGMLLLFNYHRLFSMKLLKKGETFTVTLSFLFFICLCAVFSSRPYTDAAKPIYTLFGIAVAIALMTNSEWENRDQYIPILFFFSGWLSIVCAWFFTDGFTNLSSSINAIYDNNGIMISDRVTLAGIPYTCMLSGFCYKANSKKNRFAKAVFVSTSVVCLFVVMKRSIVVNLAVAAVYFLYSRLLHSNKISYSALIRNGGILLAVSLGMYCLFRLEWFTDNLNRLFGFLQRGFATLFGNSSLDIDASAQIRVQLRNQIFRDYSSFSIWEILFGKGYMYRYLDFPLLQAFVDMGIVGGMVFLYIKLIYPLSRILLPYKETTGLYLQIVVLTSALDMFYVGLPYGYSVYIPVFMLIFYDRLKSQSEINTSKRKVNE